MNLEFRIHEKKFVENIDVPLLDAVRLGLPTVEVVLSVWWTLCGIKISQCTDQKINYELTKQQLRFRYPPPHHAVINEQSSHQGS